LGASRTKKPIWLRDIFFGLVSQIVPFRIRAQTAQVSDNLVAVLANFVGGAV